MKTLANKSLRKFSFFTFTILLCCAPLMFYLMEKLYAHDLDELIEYRRDEFVEQRLPQFETEDISVWNEYNEDVFILPFDEKYPTGKAFQEEFYNKAEGHNIYYRIIYENIAIDGQPYILMSRVPMIERHDLIGTLASQYGVLFVILLISLSVAYYYMSKKLWTPFYRTLEVIQKFNLEQGEIPVFGETDTLEFERLNEILTGLLSNNVKVYRHQKKFIENASHELQTPLAILLSQLDMLLQNSDLKESQMKTIQSLYSVVSRMTRLNKNLLLLAKMDNAQFKEKEQVDFIKLLETQLSYLQGMAEGNGITVSVKTDGSLTVEANKTLTQSLINNIVINAIRHNVANGRIGIEVAEDTFTVRNTGDEAPLDPEKIFERFSRTSEKKKGTGLGLSIVAQISKSHNWRVDYEFADMMHCFTVRFR